MSINVAAPIIFFLHCSIIWSKTTYSLTTSRRMRRKVMNVTLSRFTVICWMPLWKLSMGFVMNGLHQMQESHSLLCLARNSTFLFYELSKLRKSHRARPELTAKALRSVTDDDGAKNSGISLDGTRIWKIFEPILWIYDLKECADVPRAQSPY